MSPHWKLRHAALALGVVLACAGALALPPIPQDPAYHRLADGRTLLGIPNGLNVLSNLPFGVVGLLGLATVFGRGAGRAGPVVGPGAAGAYAVLFAGVALTTLGSAYYHLAPDDARLVWDRLPMTVAFVGLVAALLAEWVSPRLGRLTLGPLLALGVGSVAYWYWSELRGAGDLRPYLLVQFGSLLVVALLLVLYPAPCRGTGYLVAGLGLYAGAKLLEAADARIYALGQVVSGHTLKHLVAAAGVACVVAMLRARAAAQPAAWPGRADLTAGAAPE
jgi:hypothetical protein